MIIETTDFDYIYNNSQKAGANGQEYMLHNIDVFNRIIIDDKRMDALYQTAQSYSHNNYSSPCQKLALNYDFSDPALIIIDQLTASDFDDDETINEALEAAQECCSQIDTVQKLFEVYTALNDNLPDLADFLDPSIYTDNEEDYNEDKSTGLFEIKQ